jgi:hypothetical protein
VVQTTTVRTAPEGTQVANTGTGYLGNNSSQSRSWDGRIDEVRLYNRMLSLSEITVLSLGVPTNIAPVVDAGTNQTVTLTSQVFLHGSFSDDGLPNPPGAPLLKWSVVSGPGTADFADDQSEITPVFFSAPGVYVLRLTADDGQVKTVDDVTITVIDPPTVTISASTNVVYEWGQTRLALVMIERVGSTTWPLTVRYEVSGTASNGVDYNLTADPLVIPAGGASNQLALIPQADDLAEGDESVVITLLPDFFYSVGAASSVAITIKDRPWDDWRFNRFTAVELADDAISGEAADPDGDGLPNLLEYAFHFDPKLADESRGFTGALEPHPSTSADHLVLTFNRRLAPTDLIYRVEVSSDLLMWLSGPAVTEEILPPVANPDGVTETARVRLLEPASVGNPRFARLRVQRR